MAAVLGEEESGKEGGRGGVQEKKKKNETPEEEKKPNQDEEEKKVPFKCYSMLFVLRVLDGFVVALHSWLGMVMGQ